MFCVLARAYTCELLHAQHRMQNIGLSQFIDAFLTVLEQVTHQHRLQGQGNPVRKPGQRSQGQGRAGQASQGQGSIVKGRVGQGSLAKGRAVWSRAITNPCVIAQS